MNRDDNVGETEEAADEMTVDVKASEILDYLKINDLYQPVVRDIMERKLVSLMAARSGLEVSDSDLQQALNAFRMTRGLRKKKDFIRWMELTGISQEMLETHLHRNILISKMKDHLCTEEHRAQLTGDERLNEFMRNLIYEDWLKDLFRAYIL